MYNKINYMQYNIKYVSVVLIVFVSLFNSFQFLKYAIEPTACLICRFLGNA
jgi:hypothetical protein